jgi:hypothetical protein
MLFANALKRTLAVAEEIGIYAMVVDAISKEAECFYTQYGGTISRLISRHNIDEQLKARGWAGTINSPLQYCSICSEVDFRWLSIHGMSKPTGIGLPASF